MYEEPVVLPSLTHLPPVYWYTMVPVEPVDFLIVILAFLSLIFVTEPVAAEICFYVHDLRAVQLP